MSEAELTASRRTLSRAGLRRRSEEWANGQALIHMQLRRELSATMGTMYTLLCVVMLVHCAILSVVVIYCHNLGQSNERLIGFMILVHYCFVGLSNALVLWASDPSAPEANLPLLDSVRGVSVGKMIMFQLVFLTGALFIEAFAVGFYMFVAGFWLSGVGEVLPSVVRGHLLRALPPKDALKGVAYMNLWTIAALLIGLAAGGLIPGLFKIKYLFMASAVVIFLVAVAFDVFVVGTEERHIEETMRFVEVYQVIDDWARAGHPHLGDNSQPWTLLVDTECRFPLSQEIVLVPGSVELLDSTTTGPMPIASDGKSQQSQLSESALDEKSSAKSSEEQSDILSAEMPLADAFFTTFCGFEMLPLTLAVLFKALLVSLEGVFLTWYNPYLRHRYNSRVWVGNAHIIVCHLAMIISVKNCMYWISDRTEVASFVEWLSFIPTLTICFALFALLAVVCPAVADPLVYFVLWPVIGLLNGALACVFETEIVIGNIPLYSGRTQAVSTVADSVTRGLGAFLCGLFWAFDTRSILSAVNYKSLDAANASHNHLWFWYTMALTVALIFLWTLSYHCCFKRCRKRALSQRGYQRISNAIN